jgi:hypothetical protein
VPPLNPPPTVAVVEVEVLLAPAPVIVPVLPVVVVVAAVPVAVVVVVAPVGLVPVVVLPVVVVAGGSVTLLLPVDPEEMLTAGVTTVVTGVPVVADVAGGWPAAVNGPCGVCVVGGGMNVVGGIGPVGALRATGRPSGSTQLTSLFEQKLGIDVRSVDRSAANASPAPVPARTRMIETAGVVVFMAG